MSMIIVGDSISEGYLDGGTRFHPYEMRLHQLLSKNKPEDDIKITNISKSGATTKEIYDRLSSNSISLVS